MEEENSKRGFTIADIIKFIGVIGIVTPLLLGYFQYQRSVQQDKDKYFRVVVEKLSSDKKAERLSAATNLGTYLIDGGDYYEEAFDILINTVSIELDYNVLNAIRGSLEKVEVSERKRIVQKLLDIDRNMFIYEFPLGSRLDNAKYNLEQSQLKLKNETGLLTGGGKEANNLILNASAEDLKTKSEIKINVEKDYNELSTHQLLVASIVGLFINSSRTEPIENLDFYQNAFNKLVWLNFQIPNSRMENSAFSQMTLTNVDLSHSKIIGTTFQASSFSNCNFAESEIIATNFTSINVKDTINFRGARLDDVFFQGSNLKYSNFKGAIGLKPIYFYKVKNLEYVQFDDDFRSELENSLTTITDDLFIQYIYNCKLMELRANELYEVLFPNDQYDW